MINIGIIGYGYWGPNLVRNLVENPNANVAAISDLNENRLAHVTARYPNIEVTTNCQELLDNPGIDAIAIATPVSTHFKLACGALKHGKHVFVEKPMTATSAQAEQLIEEAEKRNLVLMVDHTFIYTGAVRKIKELIDKNELGEVYYYDSVRVNLGLFQKDVNVIWDLAVHDLSILDHILVRKPVAVSATGISHISGEPENVAYLTLFFDDSTIGHIHVNWLAPVKIRQTLIGGSQKMIVYDDLEPSEKIKIYDKGVTVSNTEDVYKMLIDYRTGDMYAPQLDMTEALTLELQHFIDCVDDSKIPTSNGPSGLRIVRILEAACRSLDKRGEPTEV